MTKRSLSYKINVAVLDRLVINAVKRFAALKQTALAPLSIEQSSVGVLQT
jgi:hypothetical protein